MKILYHNEHETTEFDRERYLNSLRKYGEIDEDLADKMIKEKIEPFPIRHYSVLVKEAIPLFKDDESAQKYYEDHKENTVGFERLRRITGYLVGTLERWNDGKQAEEHDRVKHNVDGVYTKQEKLDRELAKEVEQLENEI